MLTDQFRPLHRSVFDQLFRLCPGVIQNLFFILDNTLVALDLIRRFHTELPQKLVDFLFIYDNIGFRQRLKFTAVNVIFYLIYKLFNSAAHACSYLLYPYFS